MRDLIIKQDWFKGLDNAPDNVKRELGYLIFKYGCLEEEVELSPDADWSIQNTWNSIKGNIDRMKAKHDNDVELGKTFGKKTGQPDALEVWEYCQKHPKASVKEVGLALGLEPTAAQKSGGYGFLYDNEGWNNRKNADWGKTQKKEWVPANRF